MSNKIITLFRLLIITTALLVQSISLGNSANQNNFQSDANTFLELNSDLLSTLPIMHEGRIKPLSTFANITLKSIANSQSIDGQSSTAWLMGLMLNPKQDYNQARFSIINPELINLLKISGKSSSELYSFTELLPGIKQNISLITSLESRSTNKTQKLNKNEQDLLNLYHATLMYFDLSRSFSLLLPEFDLKEIKEYLPADILINSPTNGLTNVSSNISTAHDSLHFNQLSYYQILPYKNILTTQIENLLSNNTKTKFDSRQLGLLNIAKKLKDISSDRINISLKIIPNDLNHEENWLAPWEILGSGNGSPMTATYLNIWQKIITSSYAKDEISWRDSVNELLSLSTTAAARINGTSISHMKYALHIEQIYNKYGFFNKALIIYTATLLLVILARFMNSKNASLSSASLSSASLSSKRSALSYGGLILFSLAFSLHFVGLVMRMYILQRPPVANLYESILFVAFIISVLSLILESTRKDSIGIFVGSVICSILLFIANSYAQSGDSLGVIIAVLNNNFWLGTHVLAITSGYGCCLLLSAFAHVYLLRCCISKQPFINNLPSPSLTQLNKYILGLGLLSLFFTLLGTILGGIWADQSWGRFWGWDPKENGALLICLWLISLLHGRISGHLDHLKFVTGCALTSITVALAWFGVNVLGAGLHSYGFTENIATNLILFIIFEMVLVLGLYLLITKLKLVKKIL